MQPQPQTRRAVESRPPWSPFSVAVMSFVLPPGGAVLTVLNLNRLGQIDSRSLRNLTIAVILVFALGYTSLFFLAAPGQGGIPSVDSTAATVLQAGIAIASYGAQRDAFRTWRQAHQQASTSSWLGGIGLTILYTLVTFLAMLPFALLIAAIVYVAGGSVHI